MYNCTWFSRSGHHHKLCFKCSLSVGMLYLHPHQANRVEVWAVCTIYMTPAFYGTKSNGTVGCSMASCACLTANGTAFLVFIDDGTADSSSRMNSEVFWAIWSSAHIQSNDSELIEWRFTVQTDKDPKHIATAFKEFNHRSGLLYNDQNQSLTWMRWSMRFNCRNTQNKGLCMPREQVVSKMRPGRAAPGMNTSTLMMSLETSCHNKLLRIMSEHRVSSWKKLISEPTIKKWKLICTITFWFLKKWKPHPKCYFYTINQICMLFLTLQIICGDVSSQNGDSFVHVPIFGPDCNCQSITESFYFALLQKKYSPCLRLWWQRASIWRCPWR